MTEPTTDETQRARVERLRNRSAGHRPTHPALNSRIGAAAASVTAMFGLVAVMGLARPTAGAATSPPVSPPPVTAPSPTVVMAPPDASPTTPAPIVHTLRPTVRSVVPAPTAQQSRTHGSR